MLDCDLKVLGIHSNLWLQFLQMKTKQKEEFGFCCTLGMERMIQEQANFRQNKSLILDMYLHGLY